MCLSSETIEALGAMIVAPPSLGRASVFSMCFLEEVHEYDLPMDLGDDTDGVTLPDTYIEDMNMIGIGHILDATPREPHSSFDMFGVFVIDFEDVTLYDTCTNAMDMIVTGPILDAAPPRPRFIFDMFGISMLEMMMMMDLLLLILFIILFLLRERLNLWAHLFLLTLCPGFSPV